MYVKARPVGKMLDRCIRCINKSNAEELMAVLGLEDTGLEESEDSLLVTSSLANINQASKRGVIPIHLACRLQDFGVLRVLLRCEDLNVNVRDPGNSFTPIITLISNGGDIECLNLLLKRSPDLSLCDEEFGDSPLHWAVRLGLPKVVHRLVKSGMDVNLPSRKTGQTPLHLAVLVGNEEVITELVELAASPMLEDGADLDRNSVLHLCILQNIPNMALCIYNSATSQQKEALRSSVDRNGNSALHLACMHGMMGLAEFLIRAGFNKDALNDQGLSPLDLRTECQEKSKGEDVASQSRSRKAETRRRRAPRIDMQVYETPVSEFLAEHNIAERPVLADGQEEERGEHVPGKHDFVFKLFYKKGYHYVDQSFTSLTFNDLTNIGIKDKGIKDLILQSIDGKVRADQERTQESARRQREHQKRRNMAYSLTAVSTCILIFFITYVALNALARNRHEYTNTANAGKKSRSYPSSYTKYKARYDV